MLKKIKTRLYFNMIEVALAMAIIAFGMTSILGLIPVGLNASRNAIAENYCGDTVDMLMTYINAMASASGPTYETFFGTSGGTGSIKEIRTPVGTGSNSAWDWPSEGTFNTLSASFLDDYSNGAATSVSSGWTNMYKCPSDTQIYFIVHGADAANSSYDFSAMMVVWKSTVTSKISWTNPAGVTTSTNYKNTDYSKIAGLNIEISWPLEKKYSEREKRYYYLEIAKP